MGLAKPDVRLLSDPDPVLQQIEESAQIRTDVVYAALRISTPVIKQRRSADWKPDPIERPRPLMSSRYTSSVADLGRTTVEVVYNPIGNTWHLSHEEVKNGKNDIVIVNKHDRVVHPDHACEVARRVIVASLVGHTAIKEIEPLEPFDSNTWIDGMYQIADDIGLPPISRF